MVESSACPVVRDIVVMGGVPCFAGTRVPFRTLIDYLAAGHSQASV
jgi:uncharacterized protein (DUF433 family)